MDGRGSEQVQWGGRIWLIALIAVVVAILILVGIWPRSFAWTSPTPTPVPWTQAPGLYHIPTVTPAVTPAATPAP